MSQRVRGDRKRREYGQKPPYVSHSHLCRAVNRAVLEMLARCDARSVSEMLEDLHRQGLVWALHNERSQGRLSRETASKYISRMRCDGLLYYTNTPGNRLRMTLLGESTLVMLREKNDG
jgi:hypothetical protein